MVSPVLTDDPRLAVRDLLLHAAVVGAERGLVGSRREAERLVLDHGRSSVRGLIARR